jgi:hypothetical protein
MQIGGKRFTLTWKKKQKEDDHDFEYDPGSSTGPPRDQDVRARHRSRSFFRRTGARAPLQRGPARHMAPPASASSVE